MYNTLLDRLRPVTRRFRARQFWWTVSVVVLLFCMLAYASLDSARSGESDGRQTAIALSLFAAVGVVIAGLISRLSFRDPRPIAAKIEETFPSLNQRLLTAMSQSEQADGNENFGYLQQRVIREARDHSRDNNWADAMPAGQLWFSRFIGFGSIGLLCCLVVNLANARSNTSSAPPVVASTPAVEVIVEPGNTEIERGSSLAITARFSENTPNQAQLLCISKDGGERRISMTQNLDDPIVGGFIASVDEQLTYKIITDDWTSETFTIDVFEFPSLVRSDADLDYPEYTGLEDKVVEDTVRVSAVEGTTVKWLCFLNKDVQNAELIDKKGNTIKLVADAGHPGALMAEFDLRETKRLTLNLVDDAGRKNKYPPELIARVLPNQPPRLKLANARDTSVSPLEELPLGVEVRDDFGVAQVGLSYTFAAQGAKDIVLAESIERGSKQQIEHLLAMEDLKAEPDQLLSYHFWAEDFGPDGQPRRTESDMFFAEVRPFEEIYREGEPPPGGESQPQESENGQKAEELAELQKQIINATWKVIRRERGKELSNKFADDVKLLKDSQLDAVGLLEELAEEISDAQSMTIVESVRESMEKVVAQLDSAASNVVVSPLHQALASEQAAYGGLLKLRAREFQITRQQQNQSQSQSASQQNRQQQLDDLELEQDENRYETQQQAEQNSAEQQEQREIRQVLSRLRDLAKRQEDLNKQLAELQSALDEAKTEEEKEEIKRQLKRLRDQQQDLLRETDELAERMQSPENQESMNDASEQLDETRENVRKASDALEQNDASEALTAGKRAERDFEEMRDEFRQKAAGEFNDTVRDLRTAAQELDEAQEDIADDLRNLDAKDATPGLRGENSSKQVEEALKQQKEQLGELLEKMQETVEQAEVAEPLLAQKLYDTYRKTQQQQVERKLADTAELLRRGFEREARQIEAPAREGINELREELEEAATSVLGDETQSLRRALSELDQLARDLDSEIEQSDPDARSSRANQQSGEQNSEEESEQNSQEPGQQPGENEPRESQQGGGQPGDSQPPQREGESEGEGEPSDAQQGPSGQQPSDEPGEQSGQNPQGPGQASEGQPNEGQPGEGQPNEGQLGQQPSENSGQGSSETPGQQPSESPGQSSGQGQPGENQSTENQQPNSQQRQTQSQTQTGQQQGGLSRFAADSPTSQPLTGDGFREWSDGLRDVEEMVEDPGLRSRAARIRDRARDVRVDLKRNSRPPQWDLVEEMIAKPLRELRRDVQEELLRRSAEKNALVPIDRDPVPDEFTDAVQRYYENLGSGR